MTDQVVDRVRQALADEQRRLTDTLIVCGGYVLRVLPTFR